VSEFRDAAFRSGPFTVTVRGADYTIPARNAARWMTMLSHPQWAVEVLYALTPESRGRFLDHAEEGDADGPYLSEMARELLSRAAGCPWWEAERLASYALTPEALGALLLKGLDPNRLTLAAFLAAMRSLIMSGLPDTDRMRMEAELTMVPPEAVAQQPEEDLSSVVERLRGMPGVSIG